nr:UDP-glycosyltransferase 89B2-like [Tanacetum cinerariifolium]
MSNSTSKTHLLIYPISTSGHIIPLLDLISLLLDRGLAIIVVVNNASLPILDPLISSHPSTLHTLLLQNPEISPSSHHVVAKLVSTRKHFDPIVKWFETHPLPPVAIIADFVLGWISELASHLGIRHVVFSPSGALGFSIFHTLWRDVENINGENGDEDENFVISFPDILNSPEFAWWQLTKVSRHYIKEDHDFEFIRKGMMANLTSWGILYNTFEEFEMVYLDYMKKQLGNDRVWAVGPLLPNKHGRMGGIGRGGSTLDPPRDMFTWLDTKGYDSVVYICFGSRFSLSEKQMSVLTNALELSNVDFILCGKESDLSFIPSGFEDRVAGVAAGVLMLTWPMGVDQYANAKLLVDELGVGIRVCEAGPISIPDPVDLARLLKESLTGNETHRALVKELSRAAGKAVKEGSSIRDLNMFIKCVGEI